MPMPRHRGDHAPPLASCAAALQSRAPAAGGTAAGNRAATAVARALSIQLAAQLAAVVGPATGPASAQVLAAGNLEEQANRTCRSILAVVNPASTGIDITSTLRIGEANAVAISYVARPATGLPRSRKLVCSFSDKGGTFRRSRELVGVTSDGVQLGPARMRFLNRFWIGSRDADAAATALAPPRPR